MNRIFFIDNQDSFTYNLVEELKALQFQVDVYRNTVDADYIFQQIENSKANGESPLLFLSPGPGKPSDSVCMMTLLSKCVGVYPIIGICLGHQAIAEHFGADVVLAGETVHGKSSFIECCPHPIFGDLQTPISVARYHSLKVDNVPNNLKVIAKFEDMPMVIIDEKKRTVGFQFHPESILTTNGTAILKQTIEYLLGHSSSQQAV
ncbi:MAG: aminodeoxychorismate/anthranilate synthase component II [Gammaproteobacteria bacterium]|nr:aminodeoxychorismate/anthranilate synthase component II [Gammaproteobacteria bacterium]